MRDSRIHKKEFEQVEKYQDERVKLEARGVIESHDNQCLAKVTFCWSAFDLNVSMHVKKLSTTM